MSNREVKGSAAGWRGVEKQGLSELVEKKERVTLTLKKHDPVSKPYYVAQFQTHKRKTGVLGARKPATMHKLAYAMRKSALSGRLHAADRHERKVWQLEQGGEGGEVWRGELMGMEVNDTGYVLLKRARGSDTMTVTPVQRWYGFKRHLEKELLTADEVEARLNELNPDYKLQNKKRTMYLTEAAKEKILAMEARVEAGELDHQAAARGLVPNDHGDDAFGDFRAVNIDALGGHGRERAVENLAFTQYDPLDPEGRLEAEQRLAMIEEQRMDDFEMQDDDNAEDVMVAYDDLGELDEDKYAAYEDVKPKLDDDGNDDDGEDNGGEGASRSRKRSNDDDDDDDDEEDEEEDDDDDDEDDDDIRAADLDKQTFRPMDVASGAASRKRTLEGANEEGGSSSGKKKTKKLDGSAGAVRDHVTRDEVVAFFKIHTGKTKPDVLRAIKATFSNLSRAAQNQLKEYITQVSRMDPVTTEFHIKPEYA